MRAVRVHYALRESIGERAAGAPEVLSGGLGGMAVLTLWVSENACCESALT